MNKSFSSDSGRGGDRRGGRGQRFGEVGGSDSFDSATLEIRRVARVMAGGKRMSFRAVVVVGDSKGRVGLGIAKGRDVNLAVTKATAQAKKHLLFVPLTNKGTIPHEVNMKYKAARVMLKPAPVGRGIIAGGVVRMVVKMAGVQNIVSKVISGANKITVARAALKALQALAGAHPVAAVTNEDMSAYVS